MTDPRLPEPIRPLPRVAAALALVAGLLVVPTARVAACDCAMTDLPEAVAAADVTIIGTLIAVSPQAAQVKDEPPVEQMWTWAIERSRDPIEAGELTVLAWGDDGANCGVSFDTDERWLVVADLEGGALRTNGCMSNRPIDGGDPELDAIVKAMLPVSESGAPAQPAGLTIPVPAIAAGVGIAAIGLVSLWAFRRERPR